MAEEGPKSFTWLLLAIISFVIAILSFAGILASQVPVARWIFGIVFIALGILWVVRYMRPTPRK
jgi:hypothetical protein